MGSIKSEIVQVAGVERRVKLTQDRTSGLCNQASSAYLGCLFIAPEQSRVTMVVQQLND